MLTIPVLTTEGNLMLTGGVGVEPNSNFSPSASVWLLRFNDDGSTASSVLNGWLLWSLAVVLLVAVAFAYVLRHRRPHPQSEPEEQSDSAAKEITTPHSQRENEQLMHRICDLMDGQQLYLQQGLKVSDIASALDTNIRYISDCIRAERGCSLTQFVNEYRLEHAKRLLLEHPEMKISSVAIDSGFTNDKAMTRYFKEHTGMTPTEWKTTPENDNNKPIK
jgi:AraC-like DNA-binding protein